VRTITLPEQLLEFIRATTVGEIVEIYFTDVFWESPHTPATREVLVYTVPLASWEKDKEKYTSRILNNKKYVRICGLCGGVTHRGHMHDAYVCQGCAEAHYQVVY
jgi:hypothetical protein